jgi:glyoxylase-like metal-dependent hydrolase (beta-lactamase superfamily II)
VEIEALATGAVRGKRGARGLRRWLPGGWSDTVLPVNAVLVRHPDGICLFDAGQTAAATRPGHFPRWHPFGWLARFELGPEDEVAAQLRRRGIAPEDVRWVVLSHLHTDHAGGLEPFRAAEVLVSAVEWERARGLRGRLRGYLPQHWPAGLEPRLLSFDGPVVGPFGASHDLAGDGTLLVVPTPGHTPGHCGLLVRDGDRTTLCLGDASVDDVPGLERYVAVARVRVMTAHG